MTKFTIAFAVLTMALTACDSKTEAPTVAGAPAVAAPPAASDKPAEAAEPVAPADTRVLAASGLGVGGKFKPFEIVNCDDGTQYCQVCKFGGSPKIMAVGTIDDPDFKNDIQNIDAVVQKYGPDKLKAFAVITPIHDGKATTPRTGRDELLAQVKALKAELGVTLPIVIAAVEDDASTPVFDEYYNITQSRTVMFADGRNAVQYSAVAPPDLSGLNTAILAVLGETPTPAAG